MNSNGVMIGPPLLLGAAQEALESPERVARLEVEVGAAHPALDGAVLASLERVARLEAGAAHPALDGAVLASLERAEDLPRRGAHQAVLASLGRAEDLPRHGAHQAVHGALEKEERVEEDLERVAREDPARVARDLNATLLVGTLLLVGAAQESLERAEDRPRIGAPLEAHGAPLEALASPERVVLVHYNGVMIGPPLLLGAAREALESLERVARLEVEVGATHPALDGAVLASLERVARLEAGAAHPALDGAVLASLGRAEDLPRHGAHQAVLASLERAEDLPRHGAVLARVARVVRVARDLKAVVLERVAKDRNLGELDLLHGVLPPPPGAVLESQAKADQDPAGMVMAGSQLQAGHQVQVESQAKADHGIKASS